MAGEIWVVAETTDDDLTRTGAEAATLTRTAAAASDRSVVGVVLSANPDGAAEELARYLPRVMAVSEPTLSDRAFGAVAAELLAALVRRDDPAFVVLGAGPDSRDVAGILSALLGWGVLGNATDLSWGATGLTAEMHVLGGTLVVLSDFSTGRGIVTVRPGSTEPKMLASSGAVELMRVEWKSTLPTVTVCERVPEAREEVPLEEARVVVTGGRGVGGPSGFDVVEELAGALCGVVGASRAAVDAGWIPYGRQVGQTGRTVRPQLYVALGVSGAIQHKVGMQLSETIIAINRDRAAPIAEYADLLAVGDLFEIVPALLGIIQEHRK